MLKNSIKLQANEKICYKLWNDFLKKKKKIIEKLPTM